MNTLQKFWQSVPRPIRTILNVGVYGAIAIVVAAVVLKQGVTEVDWSLTGIRALDAFGLGVAVAIGRALAPWDSTYGLGSSSATVAEPYVDERGA